MGGEYLSIRKEIESQYVPERRQVQAEIIIFINWNTKECKIKLQGRKDVFW